MIAPNTEARRGLFHEDVLAGLSRSPKELPCKYFYDGRGSRLFDRICELDEYYPTRTELTIMHDRCEEMASLIGRRSLLVEYGSGSSTKTLVLLDALEDPVGYVPIDISCEHLDATGAQLAGRYPHLEVLPLCADYTKSYTLPVPRRAPDRRVVYFPGSTIGNFHHDEAREFLRHIAEICGAGGGLLIGVDLKKDVSVLERAYNDTAGVTAAFNLNVLRRLRDELDADIELEQFSHRAFYNEDVGRIEMHLVSERRQTVVIGDQTFTFKGGETIHTENSYKYSLDEFARLARSAGFEVKCVWTDARSLFSVQYLRVLSG